MALSFATVFAQQFSAFCLKKNIRVVSALPDMTISENLPASFPIYSLLLAKDHIATCEDWLIKQHYSLVFRHIAADYTSYWLHDITHSAIIHVRFIHQLDLYGATLLELNAVQQRATFQKLFYQPDPIDQALILLLQYGFKERQETILSRYASLLQNTLLENDTAITEKMIDLFGSDNALDLERSIKRNGDASAITTWSRAAFLYRSWMRVGGELYQDMATYAYDTIRNRMRNISVQLVMHGGTSQRRSDLTTFLQNEFRSLTPYFSISDTPVIPWVAKLANRFIASVYLDKNTLNAPVSHGLVLPNEISLERSQSLLRNHIMARLDKYFSDNPI